MRAIGYNKTGHLSEPDSLIEFEADLPSPGPRDLLVEVRGVSVNPVDVKVRKRFEPGTTPRITGYDAAGIVRDVGSNVRFFKTGDEVFYAGDLNRPGSNAELQIVDERIVGRKPASLDFADAAGFPLTAITAWEILFDSYMLEEDSGRGEHLLIVGAAGGVGSMLIQLAKQLTQLTVIATASRPETVKWVRHMGADQVINHHESLTDQIEALKLEPRYVASLNGTEENFSAIVDLIKPRGHIALIDDPQHLEIQQIKTKALSLSWEFMFARPMFQTQDMEKQHELLNRVSGLIDSKKLKSVVNQRLGKLSVETLYNAHLLQESGRVIGKNVIDGLA